MPRLRRDRGAVAALVAVLLSGGVLLGMGALVVDVGFIYAEREYLQSGADAAAVAVVDDCIQATGPDVCDRGPLEAMAEADYADDNAGDGLSEADLCGENLPAGAAGWSPCTDVGNLSDCLPYYDPVPAGAPVIEVRTSTQGGGGTALPWVFAGSITGTDEGVIRACSRVSWGPAGRADLEPTLAISRCHWASATNNGTLYQPRPTPTSYGSADPAHEVSLRWYPPGSGTPGVCDGMPDGFGWIDPVSSCQRTVSATNWYPGRTTPGIAGPCGTDLANAFAARRPVNVAIVDADSPTTYHVAGIARFVITGWQSIGPWPGPPGPDEPSQLSGGVLPCPEGSTPGARFCVYGYFTTGVLRTGIGPLGDQHYGAVYLRTIG